MDISFKKLPGHLLNESFDGGIGPLLKIVLSEHHVFGSENEYCIDKKNNKIMYKKSFK